MKPLEMKKKVAEVLAEKFLKELDKIAPMGDELVEVIRPPILKLFNELPEDKQVLLMYFLKQTAADPTKGNGLLDIKKLIANKQLPKGSVDPESLEKVKKQVQYIHGVVASSVLVSYGGLSDEHIAVEG